MTVKTKKPSAAQRQNKRLKACIDQQYELRNQAQEEHDRFRAHAGNQLAEHLAKVRAANHVLAANNVTIQELQDQVGIQHKLLAEAQSDGARAISQYNKTAKRINELSHILTAERRTYDELYVQFERNIQLLKEARQRIPYRLWVAAVAAYHRLRIALKVEYAHRKERLVNWWMVRRLNKARVTAMNEAGYIPEKLIKIAHKYWEADQARLKDGAEWRYSEDHHGDVKAHPTMWRRFQIWAGRA